MKYLIVVAHPDDEVLGAGASIYTWTRKGDKVDVCIMSTEAKARAFRPEDKELDDDLNASSDYLGILQKFEGSFPNIEMNTVSHLKLVQYIEGAIRESEPDIITPRYIPRAFTLASTPSLPTSTHVFGWKRFIAVFNAHSVQLGTSIYQNSSIGFTSGLR